jgi:hypothetical protein
VAGAAAIRTDPDAIDKLDAGRQRRLTIQAHFSFHEQAAISAAPAQHADAARRGQPQQPSNGTAVIASVAKGSSVCHRT